MDRRPRLSRWQHGSALGAGSSTSTPRRSSTRSPHDQRRLAHDVGAAQVSLRTFAQHPMELASGAAGNAYFFSEPGCSGWNVTNSTPSTTAPARPPPASQHFGTTQHGITCEPAVYPQVGGWGGASGFAPAVARPTTVWADRIAACTTEVPGPTFALARSSREATTEGVIVPRWLLSLGITNMLDFADAFDCEAEVRTAYGAAVQTERDMAARAWKQCRLRAPALALRLSSTPTTTPTRTTHHTQPTHPPTAPRPPTHTPSPLTPHPPLADREAVVVRSHDRAERRTKRAKDKNGARM